MNQTLDRAGHGDGSVASKRVIAIVVEFLNKLQTPGERLFEVGLITYCNMERNILMKRQIGL